MDGRVPEEYAAQYWDWVEEELDSYFDYQEEFSDVDEVQELPR